MDSLSSHMYLRTCLPGWPKWHHIRAAGCACMRVTPALAGLLQRLGGLLRHLGGRAWLGGAAGMRVSCPWCGAEATLATPAAAQLKGLLLGVVEAEILGLEHHVAELGGECGAARARNTCSACSACGGRRNVLGCKGYKKRAG